VGYWDVSSKGLGNVVGGLNKYRTNARETYYTEVKLEVRRQVFCALHSGF